MKIVSLVCITLIWLSFIGILIALVIGSFGSFRYFAVALSCLLFTVVTWAYIYMFTEILKY